MMNLKMITPDKLFSNYSNNLDPQIIRRLNLTNAIILLLYLNYYVTLRLS